MKQYASKKEIYQDFNIALKFVLQREAHVRSYEELLSVLPDECMAKVTQFHDSVKNYGEAYPLSIGFFVEAAFVGDTGKTLGVPFVLLEHESGWEWFIANADWLVSSGALIWATKPLAEKARDAVLDRVVSFMGTTWERLTQGELEIDHVEIRTERKGVMRIPFAKFDVQQIHCLLGLFSSISHLKDCNSCCFGGHLIGSDSDCDVNLGND